MNRVSLRPLGALLVLLLLMACGEDRPKADPALLADKGLLHRNVDQLTQVIIHDAFSPPVASRIYAYTSLAAYEAVRFQQQGYLSIAAQLQGFEQLPQPESGKSYNYLLAATRAFFTVARGVTFSKDTIDQYEQAVYKDFKSLLPEEDYERSLAFGEEVGKGVLKRTQADFYKETRGMAKFIGDQSEGKWRPTPPDYMDGAEPHWMRMRPMAIDSCGQFKCPPPPAFNTDTTSEFFRGVREVYEIGKNLSEEQRNIARYWDDNPFVMEHAGHLMYANKKITPVGHWIGITTIATRMRDLSAVEAAQAYVLTSVSIYDAFIACWAEKYRTNVIRPVTVINEFVDRGWSPYLQTPPFPEYPSGHSSISAAAAAVLTQRFGDNFAFEDTSDLRYIGMKRNFSSFKQAAMEASLSRVYGGIHYRTGIDMGAAQGTGVGEFVNKKIRLKE